ncbi:hypothetical protein ARMGADRAFT_1017740 [Armillaria gallica]|uniref:Uncharacterized protein n=1 Tax=Armillaria gallica TaxID=47427 RepID=A0A2H3D2M9_ARMGA|nr:hypothetical protein ARMGADRAFT_1017740 [Armillaria gallica]
MRSQGRKPRLIGPNESESRGTSAMLGTDLANQDGRVGSGIHQNKHSIDPRSHNSPAQCRRKKESSSAKKSCQRHRTLDYGHYFSFSMRARGPDFRVGKKPNAALGSAQLSLRGWGHHELRTRQPSELVGA